MVGLLVRLLVDFPFLMHWPIYLLTSFYPGTVISPMSVSRRGGGFTVIQSRQCRCPRTRRLSLWESLRGTTFCYHSGTEETEGTSDQTSRERKTPYTDMLSWTQTRVTKSRRGLRGFRTLPLKSLCIPVVFTSDPSGWGTLLLCQWLSFQGLTPVGRLLSTFGRVNWDFPVLP